MNDVIHFPKVINCLKAAAFRDLFLRALKKFVRLCPASNFGRFFRGYPFFVRKNCGGSTKKSFKIAQRYLQGKDGLLTLHGKQSPEVAALVVDNRQLQ